MILTLQCYSWGPLTHMSIAMDADIKVPEMNSFLAGTSEPDIGAGGLDIASKGVSSNYDVYHDSDFIDAMIEVAQTKPEPEKTRLLSRAAGYKSHRLGDSIAHKKGGYPNAKVIFSKAENYKTNHTCTEFFVDLISYSKKQKQFDQMKLDFIDTDTLGEVTKLYAAKKGTSITVSPETIKKNILKHQATVMLDLALCRYLVKNKPEMVKEIDQFFSDRKNGVDFEVGGIDKSIDVQKDNAKDISFNTLNSVNPENGIRNYIDDLAEKIAEKSLQDSATLILKLGNVDFVHENVKKILSAKINSINKSDRPIANLFNNVFFTNMSFNEAVFEAQKFIEPETDELKALELNMEAVSLKNRMDAAQEELNNRPFWKFWLYFTNSDRKKFELLKKGYEAKLAEYNSFISKKDQAAVRTEGRVTHNQEYQKYMSAHNVVKELMNQGKTETEEYKKAYQAFLEAKTNFERKK